MAFYYFNVISIEERLRNSSFVFHLTGSRYFGNYTGSSDIDLFTEDSLDVRVFLKDLGFIEQESYNNSQVDNLTTTVFKSRYNRIDIQLCKNVFLKKTASEIIKKYNLLDGVDKKFCSIVWDLAFKMASKQES